MKIIKLICILFVVVFFLQCDLKKREQKILVQKIKIENELCENCIGLKSIKVKYIFKSNVFLNDRIDLSTSDLFLFKMRKSKLSLNKLPFNYEYIYDEFDMSKYRSLNQIKHDFKNIIYFKKNKIVNTDLVLVSNSQTEILYYLSGVKVNELDSVKMNKGIYDKAVFPRSTKSE
jgi:hypothetical protein